jgi:hypothetical protein
MSILEQDESTFAPSDRFSICYISALKAKRSGSANHRFIDRRRSNCLNPQEWILHPFGFHPPMERA